MNRIIKTLKKDCKDKTHINVGTKLNSGEKICLDCPSRLQGRFFRLVNSL